MFIEVTFVLLPFSSMNAFCLLGKSCNSNGRSLAFGGLFLLDLRKLDRLSWSSSFVSRLMSLLVSRL